MTALLGVLVGLTLGCGVTRALARHYADCPRICRRCKAAEWVMAIK